MNTMDDLQKETRWASEFLETHAVGIRDRSWELNWRRHGICGQQTLVLLRATYKDATESEDSRMTSYESVVDTKAGEPHMIMYRLL